MKFAAAGTISVFILYTGYQTEHSKRKAAAALEEFVRLLLFAAQEIATRGTMLEELLEKAGHFFDSSVNGTVDNTVRIFSDEVVQDMKSGKDFAAAWEGAVRKVYGGMGLLAGERELLVRLRESFLLPDRETVRVQLSLDAQRLGEMCTLRRQKIENDCRLCRVLSFALAAFLMILVW